MAAHAVCRCQANQAGKLLMKGALETRPQSRSFVHGDKPTGSAAHLRRVWRGVALDIGPSNLAVTLGSKRPSATGTVLRPSGLGLFPFP